MTLQLTLPRGLWYHDVEGQCERRSYFYIEVTGPLRAGYVSGRETRTGQVTQRWFEGQTYPLRDEEFYPRGMP